MMLPGLEVPRRHKVDDGDYSIGSLELSLKHQRVVAVAAADGNDLVSRSEEPAAVVARAEQGGEDRPRIEPRQAEPVDRSVLADQRRRLAVADQGVVFDPQGHGLGSITGFPISPLNLQRP